MALGLTQPVTEMSTRNISWRVKVACALGWQPYHLHVLIVLKYGSLTSCNPMGLSRPVMGLLCLYLYLHLCLYATRLTCICQDITCIPPYVTCLKLPK
jgi:hypothetical protein